ncbi:LysE/ArgO family amino acid transporter [Undibacterium terreum]|uniref:Amino acid transporter n=1 Tax=Undibacterium terreum TaxID=1224302 RepID=A0A916ULL9_9BURK|nr:LysE/ArgO family amino acid transporter [Undibacterium terreum]GGC77244.1 amino acid transporter [Undibacterium terreum]
MLSFFFKGLGMSAGLVMAIGSQNAHVLRMGLRRQHVGLTVLVCILCEAVLISSGIAGMGSLIQGQPVLLTLARWGGAAFLTWYGLRAWRSALSEHRLETGDRAVLLTTQQALLSVLAVTLLNPHVYLDTVVLLGAIGGQQPGQGKWWFAVGAVTNAVLWFCALGFGARLLSPLFAKPIAWRLLDGLVGVIMLLLAVSLLLL